jgi:hypothetical protein
MGENGSGDRRDPTIHVETHRSRELRENKEKANRVNEAAFDFLREQFENPSDETVIVALTEMLMRSGDELPEFLGTYRGRAATDIPKDVFDETRELLKMYFHVELHSRDVLSRTEDILEAMINGGVEISSEDFQLARMVAAGHDLIQRWNTFQHKDGKLERKRFISDNEHESADKLIELMKEEGVEEIDEALLRAAFETTIPDGWDGRTVVQKNLFKDSHPVVRAIALADLGAAGMDTKSFNRGGDELFVEENLDMHNLDIASLSEDEKEGYFDRMIDWTKLQITFASGRQARFEDELGNLPKEAKLEMQQLFSEFDNSILRSRQAYDTRRGLSFEDLYVIMGFKERKQKRP